MSHPNHHHRGEVHTEDKQALKPPPMYKVVLHNDDYTPMDFVVEVLIKFFGWTRASYRHHADHSLQRSSRLRYLFSRDS